MNIFIRRALLAALAVFGAYTGGWAYFAPHHWYSHFPGFGFVWLPQLGPFNEHFASDVGSLFLALTLLSLFALRHVRNNLVSQGTGLAWLAFNVLHPIYHVQHLDMYNALDKTLNVALFPVLVLMSAALLIPVSAQREAP